MKDTLGHYRIQDRIGAGGMGVVYRARDEHLDRDVAIKVLAEGTLANDAARRHFHREALALSKLNHPNIATIHDFDTQEGFDFLVMEHIPGASLSEVLARGPLPEKDLVRLGRQLAEGLAAAHEHGLVHRDLKPGNLRVTPEGHLKILDFGIARSVAPDPSLTTETAESPFAGTLPYMSPEQVGGHPIDARSDIYSAGAVLYEIATGHRPFAELSGAALAGRILDRSPEPPSTVNRRVSKPVENIILKALEKDPDLRYQSARELAVDLERVASGAPVAATTALPAWRRPTVRALAATVLLATGIPASYYYWVHSHQLQPHGQILVTDLENSTGDPALAQAVREGLTIQLQQSRYLNVLSRDQVVDAMRRMRRPLSTLDASTGLELCRRESIPAMISGSLYRTGSAVWLASRVTDSDTGRVLFSDATELRLDDGLQDRIDGIATRMRNRLGESMTGIEQTNRPLAQVTTASYEALKQYSQATEAVQRGSTAEVRQRLEAALSLDPKFAMAHLLLARMYEALGDAQQEREHLVRAYDLRDSLPDRERLRVEAHRLRGEGQYNAAVERLTILTNLYPNDGEARRELALAYSDDGNNKRAVQELEKTLVLSPAVSVAYGDLLMVLVATGDFARAHQIYDEARRRNIVADKLTWGLGMLLFSEDRPDEARREFRALETSDLYGSTARLYQTSTLIYQGKLREADSQLERDALRDRKEHQQLAELRRLQWLARSALLREDMPRARAVIAQMLEFPVNELPPGSLLDIGLLLARTGKLSRAETLLARITDVQAAAPDAFTQSCRELLRAEIALAQHRLPEAVDALKKSLAEYPHPEALARLGDAFAASGEWTHARDQWREVLNERGKMLQHGFPAQLVLAHLGLARAHRELGEIADARAEYDAFLRIWKNADDMPLIARVVEERRALASTHATDTATSDRY